LIPIYNTFAPETTFKLALFADFAARLARPTSATTLFGKARVALGIAPKSEPVAHATSVEDKTLPSPVPPTMHHLVAPKPTAAGLELAARGVEPRLPPVAPWTGNPNVVPAPSVIRADDRLLGAAYAGGQIWVAVSGALSAQTQATNQGREAEAQRLRSVAWKREFMAKHAGFFADNQSGALSADQFHLGVYYIDALRYHVFAALGIVTHAERWLPWLAWSVDPEDVAPLCSTAGTCYNKLVSLGPLREKMVRDLRSWPSAAEVSKWMRDNNQPPSGVLWFTNRDGQTGVHLADSDTPNAWRGVLPDYEGLVGPDVVVLDARTPVGGLDDGIAPDLVVGVAPRGERVTRRLVLTADGSASRELSGVPGLASLLSDWGSVRLVGVNAQMTGDADGATLYIGLSSPVRRNVLPVGGVCRAANILHADAFVMLDAHTSRVGNTGAELRLPTERCDMQLSAHVPEAGGRRPDFHFYFSVDGAAMAVIEFVFEVGDGATATEGPAAFFG